MIRPVRPDGTIETGGAFVPVFRSRIVDRISSAAQQRVALLIAPAGYGKSVALTQYLSNVTAQWLRYNVLTDNVGLLGFLRGLADAVIDVAPDARVTLAGAYEKNSESDSPGTHLALWMSTHLREYRGTIAIDDLHVAQEDREVMRFLTALIERTRGNVSWILSSRSSAGLPIGTWLAYGDSDLAIDDHDLKFLLSEAREAARSFKLAVGDAELSELLNLTDGWATALSFALRSSTRSVDLRSVSSMTRDMMYRYLAEQVYQSFNETELAFIETAALLPQIDVVTMVEAGFDRAASIIDGLRGRAAFISADNDETFRLHDLFKDYVLHELSLRGAEATSERVNHVASIVDRQGKYSTALRLYTRSGNNVASSRIIREHGIDLVDRGFVEEVREAVASLGEKSIDSDIRGILGLIQLTAGRYDAGERMLAGAMSSVKDGGLRAELVLRYSVHLLNRGQDVSEIVKSVSEAADATDDQRWEAQAVLASSSARAGRIDQARELIRAIVEKVEFCADVSLVARILLRAGAASVAIGDFTEGRNFLERVSDLAASQGLWATVSRAHRLLAYVLWGSETDSGMRLWHAQQASLAATRAGDYYDVQMSYLMILSIETQRGNAEGAEGVERRLAELGKTDAAASPFILEAQAHRFVWQERFAEAARVFQTIRGRQPHAEDRALISAAYALCLALDGASEDSGVASTEALQGISSAERNHLTVQIAAILVLAADILSGRLTVVRRAISRLRRSPHEVTKLFVRAVEELLAMAESATYESPALTQHLDAVASHGYGGYGRYLDLVSAEIIRRRIPSDAIRLTPSEVRILRALADGRAPKQIAAEIGRSTLTVQTHIQNIARKLGGHGRADTIAVARQLGLL